MDSIRVYLWFVILKYLSDSTCPIQKEEYFLRIRRLKAWYNTTPGGAWGKGDRCKSIQAVSLTQTKHGIITNFTIKLRYKTCLLQAFSLPD